MEVLDGMSEAVVREFMRGCVRRMSRVGEGGC